jgi:hypothetical protein
MKTSFAIIAPRLRWTVLQATTAVIELFFLNIFFSL